jgi:glycerophosphoryl diester phosphodiesterase
MKNRTLFPDEPKPLVFGHRGYPSLAPENTMRSFRLCIERGVPGIEFDVHRCASGELVVVHDHNLKRLAGLDAEVENLSFADLRCLDVGSHKDSSFAGDRIPLLDELFEEGSKHLYYDMELKVKTHADTGIEALAWKAVQRHGLQKRCLVSSFNPFSIRRFNGISGKAVPTAIIYCESKEVPRVFRHGWGRHIASCSVLKPAHALVDGEMVDTFRNGKGYPVVAWTVNDAAVALRLLEAGVDGLIGNDPVLLMEASARWNQG